jgi:tRNA dimethylallyltransferase
MTRPETILIAGPTASGKSALAIRLAREVDGVIINADSMQIYAAAPVLTARPTAEDEAQAPHRLYGVAGADEDWSVGRWLDAARSEIAGAHAAGAVPILVGGTGLYFNALTKGLAEIPAIPAEIRDPLRAEPDLAVLRARLLELDPDAARRLSPNDRARITRALEVVLATGRTLKDWQGEAAEAPAVSLATARAIVIAPDRAELHARIDRRFDLMMEMGALDEVRALLRLGLPAGTGVMKAIGVRPLARFLADESPLEEAIEAAKAETRQYAKRQETWFRNQMLGWERLVP